MAFQLKKEQAQGLRKKGKSISEISSTLSMGRSTVSYWCRNISLSRIQQKALVNKQQSAGARGRLRAAEIKRAQRQERTRIQEQVGAQDVGTI